MALKEFWAQTGRWMRAHNPLVPVAHRPEIGDDGLISRSEGFAEPTADGSPPSEAPGNEIAVRAVPQREGHESLEKLQQGFDKLVEQLRGINEHLSRQVSQHEDLMGRIEQLPQLERLQSAAAKNEQFIDAVEKIPTETAKQTDALVNIDHQLAAAADVDVQRTESFNNFNDSLDKLNQSTVNQTEGILQMSKTFAASDRYLKYIISKQNKRVMWIFIAAISVCLTAILILTGIIVYLRY
jgi:ABC-type transporter Mla subunit MlaD